MVATPIPAPSPAHHPGRPRALRLIDALADIGASPADTEDERLRQGTLILASVLIVLLSFVWVPTYLFYGYPVAAAIPGAYQVLTVAGLLVLARTRRFAVFRTTQFVAFLILPGLLQASLGGFVASSGMVLWAVFTPLAALAMLGVRRALAWLAACFVWLVLLAILDSRFAAAPRRAPRRLRRHLLRAQRHGRHPERVRHARLLRRAARAGPSRARTGAGALRASCCSTCCPRPSPSGSRRSDGVIAEHYDDVSVLFADLADFTQHAMVLPAQELVALLDRIFTAFDHVADAHGVEKIKTIGDAYMVAGGLPEPRPDHLEAVARTALAMRQELASVAHQTGHPGSPFGSGSTAGRRSRASSVDASSSTTCGATRSTPPAGWSRMA